MKRIAIITLHAVKNYGSVLQTLATQQYFLDLGCCVTVIDFRRKWETKYGYWFYLYDKNIKSLIRNIIRIPTKLYQDRVFNRFIHSYINVSKESYCNSEELRKKPVEADVYCTGSDQVWNSGWNSGVIPEYFLSFAPQKSMKISFASSFGNSNIDEKEKKIIKTLLSNYNLITVREAQSVEMLKKELGLEAYEILDPTLQMNGDFWRSLCKEARKVEGDYVLLIQLNRNVEFDKYAKSFCNQKGIRLVRLCLRVDQVVLPGKAVVIPEVNDYIRLIRDATYVLIDSFHAVSFCLNLEKQFYVYYPNKYAERLKSILLIMELTDRELMNNDYDTNIDYKKVNKILMKKRKLAKDLMLKVLDKGI